MIPNQWNAKGPIACAFHFAARTRSVLLGAEAALKAALKAALQKAAPQALFWRKMLGSAGTPFLPSLPESQQIDLSIYPPMPSGRVSEPRTPSSTKIWVPLSMRVLSRE